MAARYSSSISVTSLPDLPTSGRNADVAASTETAPVDDDVRDTAVFPVFSVDTVPSMSSCATHVGSTDTVSRETEDDTRSMTLCLVPGLPIEPMKLKNAASCAAGGRTSPFRFFVSSRIRMLSRFCAASEPPNTASSLARWTARRAARSSRPSMPVGTVRGLISRFASVSADMYTDFDSSSGTVAISRSISSRMTDSMPWKLRRHAGIAVSITSSIGLRELYAATALSFQPSESEVCSSFSSSRYSRTASSDASSCFVSSATCCWKLEKSLKISALSTSAIAGNSTDAARMTSSLVAARPSAASSADAARYRTTERNA